MYVLWLGNEGPGTERKDIKGELRGRLVCLSIEMRSNY